MLPMNKCSYKNYSWLNNEYCSLYLNGVEVDADDMRSGLQLFVNWLGYSFFDEPVLLVAHNCFNFDAKVNLFYVCLNNLILTLLN